MNRRTYSLGLLLFLAAGAAAQPAPKEVRLLVIVDGFIASNQPYYKNTVVPKLTDRAFALVKGNSAAKLIVETRFRPSATLGQSNFGLRYNGLREKCYFDYDQAVLEKVHAEAGTFRPDRYLVILAGNGPGGCADGTVMFVRENALVKVVAHEMGHSLAGLFDEYGADPSRPAECVRWRNCASDAANTPWTRSTILGARPGCLGYSTHMFHAAATCLMASTADQAFCPVCEEHLTTALTRGVTPRGLALSANCAEPQQRAVWTPPPPPPSEAPGDLEVTAILTEAQIKILPPVRALNADRDPEVVTGDILAVARMNGKIVGIQPLAIDSVGSEAILTARSGTGTFERRVPREARLIRFTLFGVTRQQALSAPKLQLVLYRSSIARSSFYVDAQTLQLLTDANVIKVYDLKDPSVGAF